MLRYTVILCLIVGSLGQWMDPDWLRNWRSPANGHKMYPPLPGSIPLNGRQSNPSMVFADETTTTPSPTTSSPTTSSPTTLSPTVTTTSAPSTCSSIFSCADCNTAQICRPSGNGLIPAMQVPCPKTAPFCDYLSGTCTTVPDYTHCGNPDSFLCMGNGYFPDPTNCSVYHVCNDYASQQFFCINGQVYNPDEMKCTNPTKYTCNTVDCVKANKYTNTGVKDLIGNTHYYAYCTNAQPTVVDRCPHDYKLNTTSQVCEAICESDGLMTDLTSCLKFFKCSTIYINETTPFLVRENLSCPPNEAFEPSSYQCVPQSLTDCKI